MLLLLVLVCASHRLVLLLLERSMATAARWWERAARLACASASPAGTGQHGGVELQTSEAGCREERRERDLRANREEKKKVGFEKIISYRSWVDSNHQPIG